MSPDALFFDGSPLEPDSGEVGSGDAGPEEGGFGWPCSTPSDCLSGFCVPSKEGLVCTHFCVDSCPAGWTCSFFTAGGKGYKFTLDLPLADVATPLVLESAPVVADVIIQDGKVVSRVGVLGGAVAKQTFLDGVEPIPEKDAASLSLPKEGLKQLIGLLIHNDVDTTGDGTPDAAWMGLAVKGNSGSAAGVKA